MSDEKPMGQVIQIDEARSYPRRRSAKPNVRRNLDTAADHAPSLTKRPHGPVHGATSRHQPKNALFIVQCRFPVTSFMHSPIISFRQHEGHIEFNSMDQ
jgi:hypothetical protein